MKKRGIVITGIILILVVALIVLVCVSNLGKKNANAIDKNNFKIVTSFYPMYIITENITNGAKNIELSNMADMNGGCIHDYTLATNDVKKLEGADVFVENGLGLENFTDRLLQIYSNIKIINSSEGITDIIKNNVEENGHIWTSIDNYTKQIQNVADELSKCNPENADIYKKNGEKYIARIQELRNQYKEKLKEVSGKKVICLNEAFAYLGKDLNLDMIMVETDHEESTLSADKLRNIIDQAKENKIDTIIIGEGDNAKNAEAIVAETGAKIYKLKTCLDGDGSLNSYINDMEYNFLAVGN